MPVAFVNGDVDGLDASFISPDESAAGGERRAAPGEPRERPHLLPGGTTAAPAGDHGGADRQDLRALGAVRAARERGLDVPGDVSVVGYDDTPLLADAHPPLTSLQPVRGMGAAAATALPSGRWVPRAHRPNGVSTCSDRKLVVRGSTGPAVTSPPLEGDIARLVRQVVHRRRRRTVGLRHRRRLRRLQRRLRSHLRRRRPRRPRRQRLDSPRAWGIGRFRDVTRSGDDALARAATATHGCVPAGVGGDASVRPELSLLIRSSVHHNGALEVRLESPRQHVDPGASDLDSLARPARHDPWPAAPRGRPVP